MAQINHSQSQTLKLLIESNSHRIEFFQLIRLYLHFLRLKAKENGVLEKDIPSWEVLLSESLRIRPSLSLGFPEHEVSAVRFDEQDRLEVETTFFGLYGVTSPLPYFYSEELIANNQYSIHLARGFLDMFHYRAYQLLIRAMTRHRYITGLQLGKDERQLNRFLNLIGIDGKALKKHLDQWPKLLHLAPIFNMKQHSAAGLQHLIQAIVGSGNVTVNPNYSHRVKVPQSQQLHLGNKNHQLGKEAILGASVLDRRYMVEVVLENQGAGAIDDILPGGEKHGLLKQALDLYLHGFYQILFRAKSLPNHQKIGKQALGYGACLGGKPQFGQFLFQL
jgi:type VI secretion system protein ImpH